MNSSEDEYLHILREIATDDLDNGDYITVDRVDHGFMIYEKIVTFSDVVITRRIPKYACHAKAEEGEEDI